MYANLDIDTALSVIASLISLCCGLVDVEPKKVRNRIGVIAFIISIIITILNFFKFNYVLFILSFLQKYWQVVCLSIFALACLPPINAISDKKKCPGAVGDKYIKENLFANLLGSLCPIALLFLVKGQVGDFRFLEELPIAGVVALIVPMCEFIVFSYQSEEQKNENLDHSASLEWKNQVWNVFYLFDVIFWSLVSAIFLVFYIVYNYKNNTYSQLTEWHLLGISLVFIFFYIVCGRHQYPYLYMVFLTDAPLILICSIYWMSWYTIDNRMLKYQTIFILFHLLCFTAIVFKKEGIVVKHKENIEDSDERQGVGEKQETGKGQDVTDIVKSQDMEYKIKIPQLGIKIKSGFYIFALALSVFIILFGIYGNVNFIPSTLNKRTLSFISLILTIFYFICILYKHSYLFFIFLTDTPLLLIVSIYQMSHFKIDDGILGWQTTFIFSHLLIYVFIILYKKEIIAVMGVDEKEDPNYKINIKSLRIKIKSWFDIFTIVVLLASFTVLVLGPPSIERISFRYAQKCLDGICENTGKNADELFNEIMQQDWSNSENEDIDSKKYHQFLYDNLKQEMIDKEVIAEEDTSLTPDDLEDWFKDKQ